MPSYDPQRNRARARPVVGEPAPVDQILGRPEPAAATVPPEPAAATVRSGSPVVHAPDRAHAHDHPHDHDRRRGFDARPALVAAAATVVATVLVLRRHRRRRI